MKKQGLDSLSYLPEGGRSNYFYFQWGAARICDEKNKDWPLKCSFLTNTKNHNAKWYISFHDQKDFDIFVDKFVANPKLLKKLEDYMTKESRLIKKKLEGKDFAKLSNKELKSLIEFYYEHYLNLLRTAGTLRFLDRGLLARMKVLFEKLGNPDDFIRQVAVSERITFPVQEEKAMLKLAIEVTSKKQDFNSKAVLKKLEKIRNTFCWSVCGYYNEKPKTLEMYKLSLQELIKKDPKHLLKELEERHHHQVEERSNTVKKLDIESRKVANIAGASSYLKDYYKSSTNAAIYAVEPLFVAIAERTGKTIDFIKDLFPEEVNSLLEGKKIDDNLVEIRREHSIVGVVNGELHLLVGKEAAEFEQKHLSAAQSSKTEFKGRAACRGTAKGIVKVVLNQKEFPKLNQGDILVVHNTSPDYVPILKRAAAIIAEEGGITAHVSVISREMNIPAVIGIPHITTLLKDGDEVEIDATKGIVRILKRNKT